MTPQMNDAYARAEFEESGRMLLRQALATPIHDVTVPTPHRRDTSEE